jgi:hypothetical protein
MEKERLCECGSVADWQEVGSTWICMACRDKEVRKHIVEFKEALVRMELIESALRMFKVHTMSIPELLSTLNDEICRIEVKEGRRLGAAIEP